MSRKTQYMKSFNVEKAMARIKEKAAQSKGDIKTMQWEKWYRTVELKGTAFQDWQFYRNNFLKK